MLKPKPFYYLFNYYQRHSVRRELATKAADDQEIGTIHKTRKIRNDLFHIEKERQRRLISRIEKIKVDVKGPPEECTLIMNKHLSTPYNCAQHIHEYLTKKCALALVNGVPWDMHKPLSEDCQIHFLHFKDEDPRFLNKAFWRSGAFLLGYIIENCFKETICSELLSWAPTDISKSNFAYDFILPLEPTWKPSQDEYRILTRKACEFCWHEHPIEPLVVDAKIAMKIFANFKHKLSHIPKMAEESSSGHSVTLYKVADHIDLSRGPLVSNSRLFGRFDIVDVHPLQNTPYQSMYRAQAVALPLQLMLHQWTWNLIKKKGSKPTYHSLPRDTTADGTAEPRVHTDDPPVVIPSNLGWNQLHLPKGKTSPPTIHAESQDIHMGDVVDGGNELKFNITKHQWQHAPIFKSNKSNPSIHINSINKFPKEFVNIPNRGKRTWGKKLATKS